MLRVFFEFIFKNLIGYVPSLNYDDVVPEFRLATSFIIETVAGNAGLDPVQLVFSERQATVAFLVSDIYYVSVISDGKFHCYTLDDNVATLVFLNTKEDVVKWILSEKN